jgi:hypothetical protein
MPTPLRGEVWLIDFGMAGKTRPALVVSVAFGDKGSRADDSDPPYDQPARFAFRDRNPRSVSQAGRISGARHDDVPHCQRSSSARHRAARCLR